MHHGKQGNAAAARGETRKHGQEGEGKGGGSLASWYTGTERVTSWQARLTHSNSLTDSRDALTT